MSTYILQPSTWAPGSSGLYSPRCREGVFPETCIHHPARIPPEAPELPQILLFSLLATELWLLKVVLLDKHSVRCLLNYLIFVPYVLYNSNYSVNRAKVGRWKKERRGALPS